jgi:hypothetical protein
LGEAHAACGLPRKGGAGLRVLEALEEDGGGVADLEGGEVGHELAGAAFADAEEALDGLAVQILGIECAEVG